MDNKSYVCCVTGETLEIIAGPDPVFQRDIDMVCRYCGQTIPAYTPHLAAVTRLPICCHGLNLYNVSYCCKCERFLENYSYGQANDIKLPTEAYDDEDGPHTIIDIGHADIISTGKGLAISFDGFNPIDRRLWPSDIDICMSYLDGFLGKYSLGDVTMIRTESGEIEMSEHKEILNNIKDDICKKCNGTGEKVIEDPNFSDGHSIVFCCCYNGLKLQREQAEILSDYL